MDFCFVLGWLTLLLVLLRVVYIFTHYKVVYKGEVERVASVTHSGTTITNVDVRCESGLVLLLRIDRSCRVKLYQACIVKKIGKSSDANYARYYLKCNKRTYRAELLNADI